MQFDQLKRREFITLLGGAAAWPVTARAQQGERMRRIGVQIGSVDDTDAKARLRAFQQGLQQLGWTEGRNVQIDYRFSAGSADAMRENAARLAARALDVILATGDAVMVPLLQLAPTVPIVFAMMIDPVGGGFVESLNEPGGNVTGFMQFEYSLSGKWLELLKEVTP